ncbi:hypothetical protein B9Z55_028317 [Caenorhabditis nigoni]|nr:hypothetical protein B9Z55_028317 [Caenorhabditis nigoni]
MIIVIIITITITITIDTLVRKLERENAHQGKIINSQADQIIATELLRRAVIDNHRSLEASKERILAGQKAERTKWTKEQAAQGLIMLRSQIKEEVKDEAKWAMVLRGRR